MFTRLGIAKPKRSRRKNARNKRSQKQWMLKRREVASSQQESWMEGDRMSMSNTSTGRQPALMVQKYQKNIKKSCLMYRRNVGDLLTD